MTCLCVYVDIPGIAPDDMDINIEGNQLTISGERKQKHEKNTDTEHRIERSHGKVQRSISLPKNADKDNVSASHEDGVLTITFPKLQAQSGEKRKIPVIKK